MTNDFAVWEGAPPLSNVHGASEFERRRESLMSLKAGEPPSATIREFIDGLTTTFPERGSLGVQNAQDCPWLDDSLADWADGSALYLRVDNAKANEVRKLVEFEANQLNLVAYEPSTMQLLPSATTMRRSSEFELPPANELVLHLQAVIGEALECRHTMVGVLEERATGYYVQWMAQKGSIMLEAEGDQGLPPGLWTDANGRNALISLGFGEGDPNWQCLVDDGLDHLEPIASVLAQVLSSVRRIPVGAKMRIETFPVGEAVAA